ncbi:PEP-CTERM sorting domain-containing protein [Thalassomonas actiniarum]|uniref:PEP-CTERM sorting domain-containing protein n=1 Tax=Thalassomonas actiniarum TaxID=485447 RepID=A0AAF0C4T8_9GAMM|nr:PEP-CTERM sorting domain-containing protein [Thalassomonas actiniarum]WDE00180.1 PEP-CTERM sorting domain-containing protein [Thalassomonas actiniarum]
MTSQIKLLSFIKKASAILTLSGAISFTAQANLMTDYGAYAAGYTASNCSSACTTANGGDIINTNDGGLSSGSAYVSEVSYGYSQAYAALDGASYLPTLKVEASSDEQKGGNAEAFAMQHYSYTGTEATTIDLDINLHGSVGINNNDGYSNNSLRADVAVFIGDSLEWSTDIATLYYELASGMEKDKTTLYINSGNDVNNLDSLSFDLQPGESFFVVASMRAKSRNGYADAWNTLSLNFEDDNGLVAASAGIVPVDVPEPTSLGMLGLALSLISFGQRKKRLG